MQLINILYIFYFGQISSFTICIYGKRCDKYYGKGYIPSKENKSILFLKIIQNNKIQSKIQIDSITIIYF